MTSPIPQLKTAAHNIGIDHSTYIANTSAGLKWCTACKGWHVRSAFHRDSTRGDGLAARCRDTARSRRSRAKGFQPKGVAVVKAAAKKAGIPQEIYIARRAAGEHYCTGCRSWLTADRFHSARRARCKTCLRVTDRKPGRMTELEVPTLRELRWTGRIPYFALAKMFGKSQSAIWNACNGFTGKAVPMPWERS